MADKKFIQITEASTLPEEAYIVGTEGTTGSSTDYRYTVPQIANTINTVNVKKIDANADGVTITDAFFGEAIQIIFTSGQAYIIDVDFTQITGSNSVTLINGSTFYIGQVLIAHK